jgi:hypothetical protein
LSLGEPAHALLATTCLDARFAVRGSTPKTTIFLEE